jgi:hypothetical protein
LDGVENVESTIDKGIDQRFNRATGMFKSAPVSILDVSFAGASAG